MSKQKAWFEDYLKTLNATQSARNVGYKQPHVQGPRLKTKMIDKINAALKARAMSSEDITARLASMARAEYHDYIDEDGKVDLARLKKDGKGHLIKGIKHTNNGMEVVFYGAEKPLELLGKHIGMFKEDGPKIDITIKGYKTVSPDDWDNENETG